MCKEMDTEAVLTVELASSLHRKRELILQDVRGLKEPITVADVMKAVDAVAMEFISTLADDKYTILSYVNDDVGTVYVNGLSDAYMELINS